MLNRITFALALFGMILTVHMWVQKQRGFDLGCYGEQVKVATVSGCEEAMASDASTVLGIDNIVVGFLFYVTIAGLGLASIFVSEKTGKALAKLKVALAGTAFLFSLFLVYQLFFTLETFCSLCFTSAVIVTLILVTELFAQVKKKHLFAHEAGAAVKEIGVFSLCSFVAGVLLVADLVFVNNIASAGAETERNSDIKSIVNQVLEERFDPRILSMMSPCEIDESRSQPGYESLIDPGDPVMGNPASPVKVIDFFDPNCPHCKQIHEVLKPVVSQYGDRVAFHYKPFPLWEKSINQVEAIWLASDQGRYFEMIDLQFRSQTHEGLGNDALFELSGAAGMNSAQFLKDLKAGKYRDKALEFKQRLNAAGINSAPVILLNGQFIGKKGQTLSPECIGRLIETELHRKALPQ